MSSLPIPAVRRAELGAPLPVDYGTSPGGTIFSTTPGGTSCGEARGQANLEILPMPCVYFGSARTGTRIVYDKSALLHLKNSPLSRTPPRQMAHIPGLTKNTAPETHPEPPAAVTAPPAKPAEETPKPGTAAVQRGDATAVAPCHANSNVTRALRASARHRRRRPAV